MTNRELAIIMFEIGAAEAELRGVLRRRTSLNHRHGLATFGPRMLRARAERLARRAEKEREHNLVHGRVFDWFAACFLLAAEPDDRRRASLLVVSPRALSCCRGEHDRRMAPGRGERRSECAFYAECLGVFVKSRRAGDCHCPRVCSSFVEARREIPTRASTPLMLGGTITGAERAGTGIH